MQISFTPEFADCLRADMEIKGQNVHNLHGGGNTYELAPTHHVQLDTPIDNFWAMGNTITNTPYNSI